jgi:hypothetical protein
MRGRWNSLQCAGGLPGAFPPLGQQCPRTFRAAEVGDAYKPSERKEKERREERNGESKKKPKGKERPYLGPPSQVRVIKLTSRRRDTRSSKDNEVFAVPDLICECLGFSIDCIWRFLDFLGSNFWGPRTHDKK